MKRMILNLLAICLVLGLAPNAVAGSVEVRLQDGSTWRGDVGDMVDVTYLDQGVEITMSGALVKAARLYLIIEGEIAGETREKTIFRADVVKMVAATSGPKPDRVKPRRGDRNPARDADAPMSNDGQKLGVFYLPLEGGVGETMRHHEILEIGKHADEWGPGQTIVLKIKSNGGYVVEALDIEKAIDEVKKRHRVVAWIEKAISAGCSTAMCCDEIYFMTEGTAGSVTTLAGGSSLGGEEAERHVEDFVRLAKKNHYSEHIARAMKLNKYMCSYDKDPVTGEVTFYGDLSGEFPLSAGDQNLTFNSRNAEHCGFSLGTADTEEELAKLLDMPRWHEHSTYGRKIAKDFQDLFNRAKEEVPLSIAKLERLQAGVDGSPELERLGRAITELKRLKRWIPKLGRTGCWSVGLPDTVEPIDEQIEQLQRRVKMLRRRN